MNRQKIVETIGTQYMTANIEEAEGIALYANSITINNYISIAKFDK